MPDVGGGRDPFVARQPPRISLGVPLSLSVVRFTMTSLKLQKRLAASVLRCGQRKVWLDPNEVQVITLANSRTLVPCPWSCLKHWTLSCLACCATPQCSSNAVTSGNLRYPPVIVLQWFVAHAAVAGGLRTGTVRCDHARLLCGLAGCPLR